MNKNEKIKGWNYVLGIQKIDDYEPSDEYKELIRKEIDGEISLDEMIDIIIKKHTKN